MAAKTHGELIAQYPDNNTGEINPSDHRDLVDSVFAEDAKGVAHTDDLEQRVVEAMVNSAYGGMMLSDEGAGTISSTWVSIPFTTQAPADSKFISLYPDTHQMAFDVPGVFLVNIDFSLEHDEDKDGRNLIVQVSNDTAGVTGNPRVFGVGRDSPATSGAFSILVRILEESVGDLYSVQARATSGDLPTAVWVNAEISAVNAGVFEGDLTP